MGANDRDGARALSKIERVRCLHCSASYVKPSGGGTVSANPGCPECGYVGWVMERDPITMDAAPIRFFGDRLRRRSG
jgi:DNA-directed RNA polymerase subunit RPC12/RpoP